MMYVFYYIWWDILQTLLITESAEINLRQNCGNKEKTRKTKIWQ